MVSAAVMEGFKGGSGLGAESEAFGWLSAVPLRRAHKKTTQKMGFFTPKWGLMGGGRGGG